MIIHVVKNTNTICTKETDPDLFQAHFLKETSVRFRLIDGVRALRAFHILVAEQWNKNLFVLNLDGTRYIGYFLPHYVLISLDQNRTLACRHHSPSQFVLSAELRFSLR